MSWDIEKWKQFILDSAQIPISNAAAEKAAAEAVELAAGFEDTIDLDALGIQRIKEMLVALAASTDGPIGPQGVSGPENLQVINTESDFNQRWSKTAGVPESQIIDFEFPQNTLDGNKEIIKIVTNQFNTLGCDIKWINSEGDTTIVNAGLTNQVEETWLMEANQAADGFARTLCVAVVTSASADSAVTIATPLNVPWMAYGGILRIDVTAVAIVTTYGIHIQIQRGLAP